MTFYERYVSCCKEKGIQPSSQATADKIGCARSNISAFAKSGKTPKGDIVAGAAKMLDVSADYLLGLIKTPVPINNPLTESEIRLLSLWRHLNDEGREAAEAMIKGLVNQDIYKNVHTDVATAKEA